MKQDWWFFGWCLVMSMITSIIVQLILKLGFQSPSPGVFVVCGLIGMIWGHAYRVIMDRRELEDEE